MDLALSIVTAASVGFVIGVLACAYWRRTVSRGKYEAALRRIDEQQATIDRLLSRHFERITGEDTERFKAQFLVRHKPV
jgi:hypothetical protein